MRRDDVAAVVSVHLRAFPEFFLSVLGGRFLRELYVGILLDPSGLAFVAEVDGTVAGFVAGTTEPAGFYRRLLRRRGWRFAWASTGALLRNPRILPRLVRAVGQPANARREQATALLMSIATDPRRAGTGVGSALVRSFLDAARHRERSVVELTTDRRDNARVNSFYQRLGFSLSRVIVTPEGREMNEYQYALRPSTHIHSAESHTTHGA